MRRKKHKHHAIPAATSNGINLPVSLRSVYSQYRDFYQRQPAVEYLVRTLVNEYGWPVRKVAHFLTATTTSVQSMLQGIVKSLPEPVEVSYKNIDAIVNAVELTAEKKIRRLYYRYGLGINEIAKRLGRSEDYVRARCNFETVSPKLAQGVAWQSEWTLKKEKQAMKLVEEFGYRKAAKKLNCSVFELIYLMVMLGKTKVTLPEYEKRRRIYTCHDRALVLKYHTKGLSYVHIAEKTKVTHQYVTKVLKEAGLYKDRAAAYSEAHDPERYAEIKRLYETGAWTQKEIADIMGCSASFINRVLKTMEVPGIRGRSWLRDKVLQHKIERPSTEKDKYYEVAKQVTSAVYRRYKHIIDPTGLRSNNHHLDHALSIYDGYNRYARPMGIMMVAHPANLQIMTKAENLNKNCMSAFDRNQLRKAIKEWEEINGAVDWPGIKAKLPGIKFYTR